MQQIPTERKLLGAAIAMLTLHANAATHEHSIPVHQLMPTPTLNTLVVTANRQEVPLRQVAASVSVISAEEIEGRGHASLSDVLRSLTGINVSGNGGIGKTTALRIRGEESFRTLVLIDGMNVSDTTAPQHAPRLEHLMSSGIERVEVLRGTQGMMYGADAGGIINITTRRANEAFAADAAVEYGRHDSKQLFVNARGKSARADYSFSASQFETDGFNASTRDTTVRDDDGYENTTLHFNGGLQVTDVFRLETTVRDVSAESDYDGFMVNDLYRSDYELTAFRVSAIYDDKHVLQRLSLQRSDTLREDFANGIGMGENDGNIDEGQYQGIFRFSEVGDLVYGADLKKETLKTEGDSRKERDQIGYYAEWQGAVGTQWFYTAGVRHDDNDDFGEYTSYRASSAYLVDVGRDVLKLKASYGTGFRAPSLYEVSYNRNFGFGEAASTVLTEETSKGYDLGFEYHWHAGGSLEMVYFNQKIEDAIEFDVVNWTGYLQSPGTSRSKGVETTVMYPLHKDLRLLANYTYNDTEDTSGEQRVRRPRHIANIGFDAQPLPVLALFANVRMAKDAVDNGDIELDDYTVLEASATWSLTPRFDIYVRGENLLRDDYQEVATYTVPKAAVYAGVRMRLK